MQVKRLSILGSTGSIGVSALEVVAAHPEAFRVVGLAVARSVERLAAQALAFRPEVVSVAGEAEARALATLLPLNWGGRVVHGPEGLREAALAGEPDMVLSAMVGAAGLIPTLAVVEAGIDLALANKESLVAGGELVMEAARNSGAAILPVDSEHSAIFQALMGNDPRDVARLWLTASGGPFRTLSREELATVTPERALAHPNWSMGPKITVDSSTLMNKGLEVIEAHWLFGRSYDEIRVVVHPQSIIHSMVEYVDGSLVAQMGLPDMRLPIAFALAHPRRLPLDFPTLTPPLMGGLSFEEPDLARFPALALAYAAGRSGGLAPAVMNAANETAVEAFLSGRLPYPGIASLAEEVLSRHGGGPAGGLDTVLEADAWARREAGRIISAREI